MDYIIDSPRHEQDEERMTHTLCGLPLVEVDRWSGIECCMCTCPHCSFVKRMRLATRMVCIYDEMVTVSRIKESQRSKYFFKEGKIQYFKKETRIQRSLLGRVCDFVISFLGLEH